MKVLTQNPAYATMKTPPAKRLLPVYCKLFKSYPTWKSWNIPL
ncbi:hypothetical protein EVA_16351 [gut metagenome]|uniref:Uncharacterized protein n=1 Tax=gut metagenome TaxID=749906 RepID=J9G180_9ZZZZ